MLFSSEVSLKCTSQICLLPQTHSGLANRVLRHSFGKTCVSAKRLLNAKIFLKFRLNIEFLGFFLRLLDCLYYAVWWAPCFYYLNTLNLCCHQLAFQFHSCSAVAKTKTFRLIIINIKIYNYTSLDVKHFSRPRRKYISGYPQNSKLVLFGGTMVKCRVRQVTSSYVEVNIQYCWILNP